MSDTSEPNSDEKAKGFFLTTHGISCIPCKCKKQFYHKESKTVKEENKITTNTVEDRRNFKFGGNARHQSPDEIFKPENQLQTGSIEECTTGWGAGRRPTPEENQERIFRLETDVEEIRKDIDELKTNTLSSMDSCLNNSI